jgi:DNA repair exonuclease SbcCD nuclease subunit
MKIVVSSDWHLDHVTHGVARFAELRDAAHHTVDVAIAEGAEAYVFAGDLCDPDSGSCVFRAVQVAIEVAQRLKARKIQSIWVAGNHDVIEDGSGDTTLSPMRALGCDDPGSCAWAFVVEQPRVIELMTRKTILCLPFAATSHGYDVEKFVKATAPGNILSVSHLNVPGVIPGEETTEMPRGREVLLPTELVKTKANLVLNGHYHRQQMTADGVWIPGSLARLTFGEEGNLPGFLVMEV